MRRDNARTPIMLALAGLLASLVMFVSPGTASADTVPPLQWSSMAVHSPDHTTTTSPRGEYTVGCYWGYRDLVTYGFDGTVKRQLDLTAQVDGVNNCIETPVVDKNGTLYGQQTGGSTLLAYNNNELKWKYPFSCTTNKVARPVVGVNGNIYAINGSGRLIGVTPEVSPGQTQPTKVLDIATSATCGNVVFAFDGGLAVIWSSSTRVTYYRYDGTKIGEPTGSFTGDKLYPMNASGRLFYPTTNKTTDGVSHLKISAYNPLTKTVAWTTEAATTSRPDLWTYKSYPLPSGGVMVVVKADNPATGGYKVTLVTLSSSGQVVRSQMLPRMDPSGNIYGVDNYYAADTNGNFVVVRRRNFALTQSPWSLPITTITVIDTTSGATVFEREMRANESAADEDTLGYSASGLTQKLAIGPETAYVIAERCNNNCPGNNPDYLFPVRVPGLGLDYPRGAVLGGTDNNPAPVRNYVALGDSYSSGEGVEPFDPSTAVPGSNMCHRSDLAYAEVLNHDPAVRLDLGDDGFVACSGATTREILNANTDNHEASQYSNLNGDTKVVTITIGGNDIGFAAFGAACVTPGINCQIGSSAYNDAKSKIDNELQDKLEEVYENILGFAPNAEIYVLGYPQVAPVKVAGDPNDPRCSYLYDSGYDPTGTIHNAWGDAKAARDIVTRLDDKIAATVDAMDDDRLHYVDVNEADSPFSGHTVCSEPGESFFNNLDEGLEYPAYALHPNARGQEAYAELVRRALAINDGTIPTDPGGCGNPDFC